MSASHSNWSRGGHKRGRRGGGSRPFQNKQRKEDQNIQVDETSPVIQAFRLFQSELDAKHDKRERIIKLSRDVTIESKRVIFLLHRINSATQKDTVIQEAEEKVTYIQKSLLSKIAKELENEDIYMFLHAFSFGVQEYIEAVAFLVYIKDGTLLTEESLKEKYMTFDGNELSSEGDGKVTQNEEVKEAEESKEKPPPSAEPVSAPEQDSTITASDDNHPLNLNIPTTDFFLGIADFTGEIMRLCINSVGSGNQELPFKLANFLRQLFEGFQLVGYQAGKEMIRKLNTLRQSVKKVESACYTLQVRGSEIPKHMLLDVIETTDKQEGFFSD